MTSKIDLGSSSIAVRNGSGTKLNDSDSELSQNSEKMMTPSSSSKRLKMQRTVSSDDEEANTPGTRNLGETRTTPIADSESETELNHPDSDSQNSEKTMTPSL